VFLVAIGARIFFLIWIDEPILFIKYPYFAEKLAQGQDIGDRVLDLSPFYLYFLTFLRRLFSMDWASVKLIQSFVGALNALLILALGNRLFNKKTGIFAALLYALYGNIIILESTLEPEVFLLFFNLLFIYFLFLARDGGRPTSGIRLLSIAGGIFVGLSIITKPNSLLFLPLGIVWLLFLGVGNLRFSERVVQSLLFCGAAMLVLSPVTFRNYNRFDELILVTADAGKVFFHGNSRGASALEGINLPDQGFAEEESDEPDYAHVLFRKTAAQLTGRHVSPSESSRYWTQRTLDDIAADPMQFLKHEAQKLALFFTDYEMHHIASAYAEYKASLSFPIVRYGIIASLGLLGMLLSVNRFRELFLVYGAIGVYLFACMVFLVNSRYRMPAVPYLCLFAGSAIDSLKEMVGTKRWKTLACYLFLACALYFLTHVTLRSDILKQDRWQEATRLSYEMRARPLFKEGRYEEAIFHLNRCLSIAPDFAPALNLRGKAYALQGQYDQAEENFKKVILLCPNAPEGYRNLGFLYSLQNRSDEAEAYLTKAGRLPREAAKNQ